MEGKSLEFELFRLILPLLLLGEAGVWKCGVGGAKECGVS
jgi:hypothetical protein